MSDFGVGPPPEFPPLPIDVRSPGERAFERGRDVVRTVNTLVEQQRFDVLAFAWDVQEVRYIRAMLDADIDAVYCDRPDRMVAVVGEWRTGRA